MKVSRRPRSAQRSLESMTSPPLEVDSARQVARLIVLLKKRTEPSDSEAWTPPGCLLRAVKDWFGVAGLSPIRLQPGMPLRALWGGQTRATSSPVGELGGSHA